MKRCKLLYITLFAAVVCFSFWACKRANQPVEAVEEPVETAAEEPILADPNPLPEDDPEQETEVVSQPAPKPVAPKRETLYISTHGAQGEVYGTVTMTGNTGRGTIHDEHENTLSITVTRKGNELFGVDQNSRQYIFKL